MIRHRHNSRNNNSTESDDRSQAAHCDGTAPNSHAEQEAELARVGGNIASAVLEFVQTHAEFTGPELHDFIAERCSVAPGSADRVLRLLRHRGQINYHVVNRAQSRYQVVDSGAVS